VASIATTAAISIAFFCVSSGALSVPSRNRQLSETLDASTLAYIQLGAQARISPGMPIDTGRPPAYVLAMSGTCPAGYSPISVREHCGWASMNLFPNETRSYANYIHEWWADRAPGCTRHINSGRTHFNSHPTGQLDHPLDRRLCEREGEGPEFPAVTLQEIALPVLWLPEYKPLTRCPGNGEEITGKAEADEKHLWEAVNIFCMAGLGDLTEFYVDPRFVANYKRFVGDDGWINEAFVTYIGLRFESRGLSQRMDLLLQSVHRFSTRPVVVTNFKEYLPVEWTPERFPNMLLLHAAPMPAKKSFNFNKIRAMMFTKVRTGLVIDADQWVNRGVDYLFPRAAQEGGEDYPFPIMPVHWMSRDGEADDMKPLPKQYLFHYPGRSDGAPKQVMRWGHAHPSYTPSSLAFLAKWTIMAVAPDQAEGGSPGWLRDLDQVGLLEDEDLLNVALWAEPSARKQWCKFDVPALDEFGIYVKTLEPYPRMFPDSKYYPNGIPLMFLTAHNAKDPKRSYVWLKDLWNENHSHFDAPIYYKSAYYKDNAALHAADPALRCIA